MIALEDANFPHAIAGTPNAVSGRATGKDPPDHIVVSACNRLLTGLAVSGPFNDCPGRTRIFLMSARAPLTRSRAKAIKIQIPGEPGGDPDPAGPTHDGPTLYVSHRGSGDQT